jgi:hypothetical protein
MEAQMPSYSSLSHFMPGLDLIRNHLIKPLLFATESIVEHYIGPVMAEPVPAEAQPAEVQSTMDTTQVSN